MNHIFPLILTILIQFAFVGVPLLVIAIYRKSLLPLIAAALFFAAFSFDEILVLLPKILNLLSFKWNWEGKFLEFLWPFPVIYLFGWLTPKEVGLNQPTKGGFLLAGALGVLFTIFELTMMLLFDVLPIKMFNLETVLFQLTMPGLAEEIVYRGVLLTILNRYLGRPWHLFKTNFGWGAILVTIAFIAVHVITYVPAKNTIVWNFDYINLDFLLVALILVFLREKTGSIWPSILFHNVVNGLIIVVGWFIYLFI